MALSTFTVNEARRMLSDIADGKLRAASELLQHDEPQRRLLELASVAALEPRGRCADTVSIEQFSSGMMRPFDQVTIASHINCPMCHERLEKAMSVGQERRHGHVLSISRQLRQRSVANTSRAVQDHWRTSVRHNVYAILAETCVGITAIASVLASHVSRLQAAILLLLAIPTFLGFMSTILPRVRQWFSGILIPALADGWFVFTPSTPARRTDLRTSWLRELKVIAVCGCIAYTYWGLIAACMLRNPFVLLLALSIGAMMNGIAWERCRRIDMTWATSSRPRDLHAGRPLVRRHHWYFLVAYLGTLVLSWMLAPHLVIILLLLLFSYVGFARLIFRSTSLSRSGPSTVPAGCSGEDRPRDAEDVHTSAACTP